MGRLLTDYQHSLDFLFRRTTGAIRPGLDRTRALLRAMGDPQERFASVHVAGTNGKGSTVATLDTLLRAQGRHVGRYTSPHLVDFRERIVVDGAMVDADFVVRWIERWTPTIERINATFFEATTAMAFEWFADQQVDVAVVETGLGGRLDSTNVLAPLAAGVTNVSVDHVEYLGATLELIAAEKAGIFKPGVPAVIGEPQRDVRALLAAHAERAGARPVVATADAWRVSRVHLSETGTRFQLAHGADEAELWTSLAGRHQAANAATALALLDVMGPEYRVSLADARRWLPDVRLAGRLQWVGPWLFDVAHNPEGSAVLAGALAELAPSRPVAALFCVLADKDWRSMMSALAPLVDRFVVTLAPTAPTARAWDPAEAAAFATAHGWSAICEPDFDRALAAARQDAATVVITGSFHTVGDAMARLQVHPLAV